MAVEVVKRVLSGLFLFFWSFDSVVGFSSWSAVLEIDLSSPQYSFIAVVLLAVFKDSLGMAIVKVGSSSHASAMASFGSQLGVCAASVLASPSVSGMCCLYCATR